jgi:hypothetical protein
MATLESVVGWLSVQEAIDVWPDAPGEEDNGYAELVNLMATAHEVLEPKGERLDPAPERYRTAQVFYMQHLWNRKRTGNGETTGPDGYQVSTYHLEQDAYRLMRQRDRKPGRRIRGLV